MPVVGTGYPTIEDVTSLARALVNDTFKGATGTPGEGRVFTDDAPFVLPLLNAALSDYQRELDSASIPTFTKEVIFLNVPPINSNLGVGQPNPAAQQNLNYTGFFDGYQNYSTPALPSNLLVPKRIWERSSNTGLTFSEVDTSPAGLESQYQDSSIGQYDWRGDAIYWNGALIAKDIRLRYTAEVAFYGSSLSPSDFPTTPLPFRESVEALAYLMAEKFCSSRLPPGGTSDLQMKYKYVMDQTINRQVKRMQSTRYARQPYGQDGDLFGNW